VKGIFLGSSVEGLDGFTDHGYYVDKDGYHPLVDGIEEMVENDEAYSVRIHRDLAGKVQITLESANRHRKAVIEEDVGVRQRGMERAFYHRTDDPVLPHHFQDRKANEVLTTLAEYTLEHGSSTKTEVEEVNWDKLMDDENYSTV
jgi:hypothetical protein